MKKNKMMRLASGLLVAVLLTTCAISGTFAKYTTQDSASDSARVAKWGVTVAASGTLFNDTYTGTDHAITVQTNATVGTGDNLVAPGTVNAEGMTFSIKGTPEVKVKVDVKVTNKAGTVDTNADLEDIFLKGEVGKKLPDMTTGNASDTFDHTTTYYPVVYKITQTNKEGTNITTYSNLEALANALEGLSEVYDVNKNLTEEVGDIKVTWAWDFDDNGAGTYDKQDTLLGDIAAGTTLTPDTPLVDGTDYNLTTDFSISITVTQVD